VTGMEGEVIQMQDLFVFKRVDTGEDGTVIGEFRATGLRPKCLEEMTRMGFNIPAETFDPSKPLLSVGGKNG